MSVLQSNDFIGKSDIRAKRQIWPAVSIVLVGAIATFLSPGFSSIAMGYLLFLALIVVSASWIKWSSRVTVVIGTFMLMIMVGMTHVVGNEIYDVFKDIWYFSYAASVIVVGYLFGKLGNRNQIYSAFVVLGAISATIYLAHFVVSPSLIAAPAIKIRSIAGTGYYAVCIGFILGLYRLRGASQFGRVFIILAMALCGVAIILSFSRTMYIVFAILMLSHFGWLDVLRHAQVRWGAVCLLVGAIVLVQISPQLYLSHKPTYVDKVIHSLQEIRIKDYSGIEEINTNWRGYETARALETYSAGRPDEWLLGRGFGQLVDLGFFMNLSHGGEGFARDKQRYIPVLHNGYAYLLVKTGLVGVSAYLAFLWWLMRIGSQEVVKTSPKFLIEGRLIVALAVAILLTTSLISGLFNRSDFVPLELLLGSLLGLTDSHVWQKRGGV